MRLETRRIADLLECHFRIPAYQRGYRWEERQVSQLLEDLAEYRDTVIRAKRTESKNTCSDYYCLQPVVVVRNDALSESYGHDVYDVIDRQQRLITLYLILKTYESQRRIIFEEKYDDAHNGKTFDIEFERGLGDYLTKRLYINDDSKWKEDINAFFIKKAYATIEDFDKDRTTKRKRDVIKALLGDEDHEDIWITKIIWYDLTGTGESSIEVFKRLNKNKIELTGSELVKALLFECDRFADRELRKKDVLLMSAEWDAMEQELQDDRFWSMLASPDYCPPSRISIVLHKVARDLCREHSFIRDKNFRDDKFDYYVIEEYLKREDGSGLEDRIGEVWRMMQDTFSVMRNWRDDRETYHLIGFLTSVMTYERKGGSEMDDYIDRLYDAYRNGTKRWFRDFLRCEVYRTVRVNGDDLSGLRYGRDDGSIFKILLLLNVHTMIERGSESALYPFDKQKRLRISSLEHIHPQNMHDDIKSDRKCYEHKVKPWIESKIWRLKNGPKNLKEKVDEGVLRQLEQVIEDGYDGYCANIEEVRRLISRVDKVFCDYINLSEEEMHSLCNMALITREDNSALSNLFHDEKREKIKELCRHKDKYIPLCTRMVFDKEYSNPLNMSFWEKEDRDAYYREIERVYDFYRSKEEVLHPSTLTVTVGANPQVEMRKHLNLSKVRPVDIHVCDHETVLRVDEGVRSYCSRHTKLHLTRDGRKTEALTDLLDEYGIVIPVIQRDYAFGRKEQEERRESFLDALFELLRVSGSRKSFDFIYGRPDEVSGRFVPLDGQQRLTTLWLLYWYLFQRAGRYEEIAGVMNKFSYETRVSSKRFCRLLSSWRDGISGDGFINEIKDSPQFDDRWMLDPTVDAMLRMLEAMHSKVERENIDASLACDQCLARAHRFDLLDMSDDNFRLTDSLYVKMNGRGKQLTDFENWKASFIDFLGRRDGDRFTPVFGSGEKPLKDYFSDRMEHEWTDMLWPHAFDKWNSLNEDEKRKAKYPIIDDMFMSLFGHITEMLYYSDCDTGKAEADIIGRWETVYAKRGNLEFLFDALDLLCRIKADDFWDKLMDGISLFDNDDAIDNPRNLFERAIGGFSEDREGEYRPRTSTLGNDQKVLLYFILRYCIHKKQAACDENLRDLVRVVRNVAVRTKQLSFKTYRYSSNLRMHQLYRLNKDIDKLITSSGGVYSTLAGNGFVYELKVLDHEVFKAGLIVRTAVKGTINALENMEIFRGDLSNLPLDDERVTAEEVKEAVDWFVEGVSQAAITNERIRLLVAYSFKGLNHGSMRFYGTGDRWDTIFQFGGDEGYREELRDILLRIVTDRREAGSTEELIARQPRPQPDSKDAEERIRYYILRYPAFMDIETGRDGCTHLFYIYGNSLERGKLMQWGSFRSVRSYNVNPFYFLIKDKLGDQAGQIYFRDYDIPALEYKGVKMDVEDFRWNVKAAEDGVEAFMSGPLKKLTESEAYQKADLVEQGIMLLECIFSNY